MRSASDRLPLRSTLFTSAVTSGEPYTGSVTSCRLVAGPLRGMSALLLLRAVAAAGLLAVADALGVQGAADHLVAHAGKIPHPPATDQHDGVLLEVVAHSWDVGGHLDVAGEPDPGDLAERRVRLLGRGGVDARADSAALRTALQRRRVVLGYLVLPTLTDQLLDRGHRVSVFLPRCTGGRIRRSLHICDLRVFPSVRPPWSGVSPRSRRIRARYRARTTRKGKSFTRLATQSAAFRPAQPQSTDVHAPASHGHGKPEYRTPDAWSKQSARPVIMTPFRCLARKGGTENDPAGSVPPVRYRIPPPACSRRPAAAPPPGSRPGPARRYRRAWPGLMMIERLPVVGAEVVLLQRDR